MGRIGRLYRRARSKVASRPTFFSWVEENKLGGCGLPASKRQVNWLKGAGATTILSLTEDALPQDWIDGMEYKHISMRDHAPPEIPQLREAADYIDKELRGGKVVVVHCLAGKGRTGSVFAAYMIIHGGKTAREALEALRAARPGSVERAQQSRIFELEDDLRATQGHR